MQVLVTVGLQMLTVTMLSYYASTCLSAKALILAIYFWIMWALGGGVRSILFVYYVKYSYCGIEIIPVLPA